MSPATKATPRVYTVILNWNQPSMTLDCVKATLEQETNFYNRVLIVDNGSTGENRAQLKERLPVGCTYVENAENLGFAGGMNRGIEIALAEGYDFVWLLNNDTIPLPGCLQSLVDHMESLSELVVLTPSLRYPDGRLQATGSYLDIQNGTHRALSVQEMREPSSRIGTVAVGSALLVRCNAVRLTGSLDERFFMYREEDDLCIRFAELGGAIGACEKASCIHRERASSGGGASPFVCYLMMRNTFRLIRKHTNGRRKIAAILRLTASSFGQAAGYRRLNEELGRVALAGVFAGLRGEEGKPAHLLPRFDLSRIIFYKWYWWSKVLSKVADWLAPMDNRAN